MKHTLLLLIPVIMLAAACSNQPKQPDQPKAVIAATTNACYAYISAKDTIRMNLVITGSAVTGQLSYRFFEKDQSSGTLNGRMYGDTLLADYRFRSEGIESLTEVVFLKNGDAFTEGYGDMNEVTGKQVFKDPKTINFPAGFALTKTACSN